MNDKKNTQQLEKLLKDMSKSFNFLSWKFKLPHESKEDLIQDLNILVIENFKDNEDKGIGWWYLRAKWCALNRLKKSLTEPINKSISIDSFLTSY